MMISTGKGAAHQPTIAIVNHAPPTDPKVMRQRAIAAADAALASAEVKVERQEQHVAAASGAKKKRQQEHLRAAKEALAEAIAARKELD